jgi:hypothetical protein
MNAYQETPALVLKSDYIALVHANIMFFNNRKVTSS